MLLKKLGEPLGLRYALPGGAQEIGETLEQALIRECEEEIATRIEINDLLHVADFFKHRNTTPPSTRHQLEFLFACQVSDVYQPTIGSHPDKQQIDVVWVEVQQLTQIRLFPESVVDYLQTAGSGKYPCYLGRLK